MLKNKLMIFRILLFITMMTCFMQVNAQRPIFMMSSIKSMDGSSSNVSAINFKSTGACLDVRNGVAVLKGERNKGEFTINCKVTMSRNNLGIKLYPNPVTNAANIKFVNAPPLTEVFSLSIWNAQGVMISNKKETGYNLFHGLPMDLSGLTTGSYILKIESSSFVDAVEFIKAN
jgi:hypothetical protein